MKDLFRQFAAFFGARDPEAPRPAWMDAPVHKRNWGEAFPYIAIKNYPSGAISDDVLDGFEERIHDLARDTGLKLNEYDVWINRPHGRKAIFIGAKSKEICDRLITKISEMMPHLRPDRILTPQMAEERKARRPPCKLLAPLVPRTAAPAVA